MTEHDEEFCPYCRDCDGCDGGSGRTPKNWRLESFPRGKYARVVCVDCGGHGQVCTCDCHNAAVTVS